jgi:predicted dehydrogenase
MSYSVLICGCGQKGCLSDAPSTANTKKFLSYAHAVKEHPGFELLGFVDKDGEKGIKAIELWTGANYCCINHAMEFDRIDIAIISTPDETHYDILKQLADYSLKLVICEKPLCTNLQQALEIVELYRQKNIPILVDYTRRFIPEYQQMKAEIDAGKAGKFLKGYCYYNRGTLHTLSHFMDLALWFNGNIDNIIIQEVPTEYRWVFQWGIFYENEFYSDHAVNFVKNQNVSSIYDNHLIYVINNAWNYLQGKEQLRCNEEDGLKALEECIKFGEVNREGGFIK